MRTADVRSMLVVVVVGRSGSVGKGVWVGGWALGMGGRNGTYGWVWLFRGWTNDVWVWVCVWRRVSMCGHVCGGVGCVWRRGCGCVEAGVCVLDMCVWGDCGCGCCPPEEEKGHTQAARERDARTHSNPGSPQGTRHTRRAGWWVGGGKVGRECQVGRECPKWDECSNGTRVSKVGRECPKWEESVQSGTRVSKVGRECPKWDEGKPRTSRQCLVAATQGPGAWGWPRKGGGGGRRKRKREREGQKKKKQTKHTHPKKSTITSYFFFIKHPFLYCEAAGVSGLRVGVCCQAGRHTSLHMASLALKAARLGAWLPRQSCGRSAGSGVVCVGHSPNPGLVCSIPSYYWGDCAKKHAHIKNTSFEFLYLPK